MNFPSGIVPSSAEGQTSRRLRWRDGIPGLLFAMLAATYVFVRGRSNSEASDFDQLWHGAQALLQGKNPYEYVGPTGVFAWEYLFYPLPAIVLAAPFALLPLLVARACFAAISAGLFAVAVLRDSPIRWMSFLSAPMLIALGRGQWSPLLVAAAYLPWFAWFGVAKPNIALAVLMGSRYAKTALISAAIGGAVLIAASFLLFPGWVTSWRDVLTHRSDSMPMLPRLGGVLVLLALLRWRRPEARMVVALSCVPQTPSLYDTVPLFMVPRGFRETSVLVIGGNLAFLLLLTGAGPQPEIGQRLMFWSLVCLFLPAVLMILRRPNNSRLVSANNPDSTWVDRGLFVGVLISFFFSLWATLIKYDS